jgi:hypothetical protein
VAPPLAVSSVERPFGANLQAEPPAANLFLRDLAGRAGAAFSASAAFMPATPSVKGAQEIFIPS